MKTDVGASFRSLTLTLAAALVVAACGGPLEGGGEAGGGMKPQAAPPPPALAPNVTLGPDVRPKDSSTSSQALLTYDWTVTVSISNPTPWVNETSLVTVTASADVGPTPYYIFIRRDSTVIASCGSGTTCSAPVSSSMVWQSNITAWVGDTAGNIVSGLTGLEPHYVNWHCASFQSLNAGSTTLAAGAPDVLTSTSTWDVGPSPFYVGMYDVTAGTWLGSCGFGTTCMVTANQAAPTTHAFQAYCGPYSGAFPPAGALEAGPIRYVTWNNTGYRITLTKPDSRTALATTNVDVGPTPYYIELFDQNSGALLATCASGTTCQVTNYQWTEVVAFITKLSSTISLPDIQATSDVVITVPRVN